MLCTVTQTTRTYRLQARAEGVERTRERILRAAKQRFFTLPYDDVRLADVAADAGVTQQTLLNHFTSKERLVLSLVEFVGADVAELRGPVRPGDVEAAARALMREYEALGDATVRLLAVAERIPELLEGIERARTVHIAWLEEVFAEHLPAEPRARRRAIAALYAVTDVGTWKLLRRDLRHSRVETTAVLKSLLRAALATPEP
jgi:AcrR family transcriptional regulator